MSATILILMSLFLLLLVSMSIILIQPYEWEDNNIIMKSTLKVHNPRVIILLICTTDGCLEGLKLMHTLENIQQPSLLAVESEPF